MTSHRRRSFCDSQNKRKKIKPSPEDDPTSADAIPDEILATEILPRLADSRTAIRSSAVSKLWRSHISAADFIPNFIRHHRLAPSYFTMFATYRCSARSSFIYDLNQTYATVQGPDKMTARPTVDFGFNEDVRLHSASGEFLLYETPERRSGSRRLHVCNIVTGQQIYLPELPGSHQISNCALVTDTLPRLSFSVLAVDYYTVDERRPLYYYTVFSSETGRWSEPAPGPLLERHTDVVAHGGSLFWLVELRAWKNLVIFDPAASPAPSWRCVAMPRDLLRAGELHDGSAVELRSARESLEVFAQCETMLRIGVVQGRLRLAQVFRTAAAGFVVKVWELNDGDDGEKWRLVKHVCMKGAEVGPLRAEWMYVLGFDPVDEDAVFVSWDRVVYRYRFSTGEYGRVFRLSSKSLDPNFKRLLPRFSHFITVNHPIWPTQF